jgi:hypothetical protein
MISRDSMMEPILKASPTFGPVWYAFVAQWEGRPEGLPLYLALSDLAKHIATLFERGAESELREIFRIVERWLRDGDAYVREAATVGLFEDLQNTNLVGEQIPTRCLAYLGPVSLRWWRKVENSWVDDS